MKSQLINMQSIEKSLEKINDLVHNHKWFYLLSWKSYVELKNYKINAFSYLYLIYHFSGEYKNFCEIRKGPFQACWKLYSKYQSFPNAASATRILWGSFQVWLSLLMQISCPKYLMLVVSSTSTSLMKMPFTKNNVGHFLHFCNIFFKHIISEASLKS